MDPNLIDHFNILNLTDPQSKRSCRGISTHSGFVEWGVVSLEISALYSHRVFRFSHSPVSKVHCISVQGMASFSTIISVWVVVEERRKVLEEQVSWWAFPIRFLEAGITRAGSISRGTEGTIVVYAATLKCGI